MEKAVVSQHVSAYHHKSSAWNNSPQLTRSHALCPLTLPPNAHVLHISLNQVRLARRLTRSTRSFVRLPPVMAHFFTIAASIAPSSYVGSKILISAMIVISGSGHVLCRARPDSVINSLGTVEDCGVAALSDLDARNCTYSLRDRHYLGQLVWYMCNSMYNCVHASQHGYLSGCVWLGLVQFAVCLPRGSSLAPFSRCNKFQRV